MLAAETTDVRPLNGSAGIVAIKRLFFFFLSDGSVLTPLKPSYYPHGLSSHSGYRNSEKEMGEGGAFVRI